MVYFTTNFFNLTAFFAMISILVIFLIVSIIDEQKTQIVNKKQRKRQSKGEKELSTRFERIKQKVELEKRKERLRGKKNKHKRYQINKLIKELENKVSDVPPANSYLWSWESLFRECGQESSNQRNDEQFSIKQNDETFSVEQNDEQLSTKVDRAHFESATTSTSIFPQSTTSTNSNILFSQLRTELGLLDLQKQSNEQPKELEKTCLKTASLWNATLPRSQTLYYQIKEAQLKRSEMISFSQLNHTPVTALHQLNPSKVGQTKEISADNEQSTSKTPERSIFVHPTQKQQIALPQLNPSHVGLNPKASAFTPKAKQISIDFERSITPESPSLVYSTPNCSSDDGLNPKARVFTQSLLKHNERTWNTESSLSSSSSTRSSHATEYSRYLTREPESSPRMFEEDPRSYLPDRSYTSPDSSPILNSLTLPPPHSPHGKKLSLDAFAAKYSPGADNYATDIYSLPCSEKPSWTPIFWNGLNPNAAEFEPTKSSNEIPKPEFEPKNSPHEIPKSGLHVPSTVKVTDALSTRTLRCPQANHGCSYKPKRRNSMTKVEKLNTPCDLMGHDTTFHYIRMRGVPWKSTKQTIVNFFVGLKIDLENVLLLKLENGRDSGEALVRFNSEGDYKVAFSFHKMSMGKRYIETFVSGPREWQIACKRNCNSSTRRSQKSVTRNIHKKAFVAILRGIPYSTHPDDISEGFLAEFPTLGVFLPVNEKGQPAGICYVEFETEELRDSAISAKHNTTMAYRYIEMFKSSHQSLIPAVRFGQERGGRINRREY